MGDDFAVKYWIWLQEVLGPASDFAGKLLSEGISAEYVYNHRNDTSLLSKAAKKKALETDLELAVEIIEKCKANGIKTINPFSKEYPKSLLNISDPPLVLYYKGELPDFDNIPTICIVGPRKVSDYGYKCAYSLSARLSIGGMTIISGGAIGCDYAAHDGALFHGGKTVAVLGNGLCNDYLKQNSELRSRIEKSGCLITEYPPDTPASRFTFPKRNRIMAALSDGTVLIEAPKKSGALITAGLAVEFGKDLFVITGTPSDKNYEGSNLLLRDGAKPLFEVGDVFGEYLWTYPDKINIERAYNSTLIKPKLNNNASKIKENDPIFNQKPQKIIEKINVFKENDMVFEENIEKIKKILPENLSKNAKIVYNHLDKQIFSTDDLLGIELNAAEITSALGELEIFGFICGIPGGRYSLK